MIVQNVITESSIEESKLTEKINQLHNDESYKSFIITPLDLTSEPRTYGLVGVKTVEE